MVRLFFFFLPFRRYTHLLGFPPADVNVRVFLMEYKRHDPEMQQKSYSRACHFLLSLFDRTKDLVVELGANNKKDRIVKFREYMSEKQTFAVVGDKRREFYDDVVKRAQKVR